MRTPWWARPVFVLTARYQKVDGPCRSWSGWSQLAQRWPRLSATERLGGTRGFVAEPRSLGRLLDVAGFRDRPWHRQYRVHLDHRGQAARAEAGARPPAGARHGAGYANPLTPLIELGHRAHRAAVYSPWTGDLRARRDPDRRRALPAWQEHLRDPREPRGRGGSLQRQGQGDVRQRLDPDHPPRHGLLARLSDHRRRHGRSGLSDDRCRHGGHTGDAGLCRGRRRYCQPPPHPEDARPELPAADRLSPSARRFRPAHPQGLHLLCDGFLRLRRTAEHPSVAPPRGPFSYISATRGRRRAPTARSHEPQTHIWVADRGCAEHLRTPSLRSSQNTCCKHSGG